MLWQQVNFSCGFSSHCTGCPWFQLCWLMDSPEFQQYCLLSLFCSLKVGLASCCCWYLGHVIISCSTLSFSIIWVTLSALSIPSVYSVLAVVCHPPPYFVKRNLEPREVKVCFLRFSGSQTCSTSVTDNAVKNPEVRKQYNFLNVNSYPKILTVRSKHQSL